MWWLVSKKRFRIALSKVYGFIRDIIKESTETKLEVSNLKERIAKLEGSMQPLSSQVSGIKVSDKGIKSETKRIETRIASRFMRNKKEMIKNAVSQLLPKNLPTSELEYVIVKKKGLCSRASFYRYLSELEKSQVSIKN